MHILIVDDHDLFRQGLAQSLLEATQVTVVSEADSVASARKLIHAQYHDFGLVILDHGLPDGEGLTLLKEVQQHYPLLPIAMLSAHEDMNLMRQCMDLGALGFIPKSTNTSILISAIKLMLSGGTYIPPSLYFVGQQSGMTALNFMLTKRQEEVMALLCCGLSNKEIAYRLDIAEATVKAHVTAILKFRGVASRTMLIAAPKG